MPSSAEPASYTEALLYFPDIDTALKAYETQLFGEVDGVFDSRY